MRSGLIKTTGYGVRYLEQPTQPILPCFHADIGATPRVVLYKCEQQLNTYGLGMLRLSDDVGI
jgi:hypothetical protein